MSLFYFLQFFWLRKKSSFSFFLTIQIYFYTPVPRVLGWWPNSGVLTLTTCYLYKWYCWQKAWWSKQEIYFWFGQIRKIANPENCLPCTGNRFRFILGKNKNGEPRGMHMHAVGLVAGMEKATWRDQTRCMKENESGQGLDASSNAPVIKEPLLHLVITKYLLSEMEGWILL